MVTQFINRHARLITWIGWVGLLAVIVSDTLAAARDGNMLDTLGGLMGLAWVLPYVWLAYDGFDRIADRYQLSKGLRTWTLIPALMAVGLAWAALTVVWCWPIAQWLINR